MFLSLFKLLYCPTYLNITTNLFTAPLKLKIIINLNISCAKAQRTKQNLRAFVTSAVTQRFRVEARSPEARAPDQIRDGGENRTNSNPNSSFTLCDDPRNGCMRQGLKAALSDVEFDHSLQRLKRLQNFRAVHRYFTL